MQKDNTWKKYTDSQVAECNRFCKGYMDFLSEGKTERECVAIIKRDIEAAGYKPLEDCIRAQKALTAGDKVYCINMNKSIVMFNIGEDPLEDGMNIYQISKFLGHESVQTTMIYLGFTINMRNNSIRQVESTAASVIKPRWNANIKLQDLF
jgi:hypothetical protein